MERTWWQICFLANYENLQAFICFFYFVNKNHMHIYFNLLKLPFWLDWLLSSFSWVSSPFHRRRVFLVFLTFWNRMQVWIWAIFLYGHGNRVTREGENLHWKFFFDRQFITPTWHETWENGANDAPDFSLKKIFFQHF